MTNYQHTQCNFLETMEVRNAVQFSTAASSNNAQQRNVTLSPVLSQVHVTLSPVLSQVHVTLSPVLSQVHVTLSPVLSQVHAAALRAL